MEQITKVSDTEIRITKTIPEVVIPEKVEETVVSILDLKQSLGYWDRQIAEYTGLKNNLLSEMATIDAKIESFNLAKTEIEAQIAEAVKQGVVESKPKNETKVN